MLREENHLMISNCSCVVISFTSTGFGAFAAFGASDSSARGSSFVCWRGFGISALPDRRADTRLFEACNYEAIENTYRKGGLAEGLGVTLVLVVSRSVVQRAENLDGGKTLNLVTRSQTLLHSAVHSTWE